MPARPHSKSDHHLVRSHWLSRLPSRSNPLSNYSKLL
jgi:hypothetical protein